MTNGSRFACEYPGWFRTIWHMIRYWSHSRNKIRGWISDRELGEQFQLSEEEELMMLVLSENMDSLADAAGVRLWESKKFWTAERIDVAKDRVLAAVSARRHGDDREWLRLESMKPSEWMSWLRQVVQD